MSTRRCRQRLMRNQQIDVLAAAQAEIAEGQQSKRCALEEYDGQIGLVEQALQPQCFSGHSQVFAERVSSLLSRSRGVISGGTFGRARVSPS